MVDKTALAEQAQYAMREFPYRFPEMGKLQRGKVRDNYLTDDRIVSIATDRVSAFDRVMSRPIPLKGEVLTRIAKYHFDRTSDIVPNHAISNPDPNVLVVRRLKPFEVEFIIRGYITGSAWKDYAAGARQKSGIPLPDGLRKNQRFEPPIITNTTKAKEGHDLDISQQEILERKLLTPDQLKETERVMQALYKRGVEIALERNLNLVDTKYEMGIDEQGRIHLIDEVHTPDSSRYWTEADKYEERFARGEEQRELSKEFLRIWLKERNFTGEPNQPTPDLPLDVIVETAARYQELCETVTGEKLIYSSAPVADRIRDNLIKNGVITGGHVQIIAGSEGDKEHYEAIRNHLKKLGVPSGVEILSAHKQTRQLLGFLDEMSKSDEPVVYIAVAGRSNALGAVVAAPANNPRGFPTINCPPFKDLSAYAVDIHSSLRLPSKIPAVTVLEPENAAIAARDILKLAGAKFKPA